MTTTKNKVINNAFLEVNGYSLDKCFRFARLARDEGHPTFFSDFVRELSQAETASSVSVANRCGRLYSYKYEFMVRRNKPPAVNLALGTLVHNGLEYYWNMVREIAENKGEDTFLANSGGFLEALDLSVSSTDSDFWSNEKSDIWKCQATAFLRGYHGKYIDEDAALYHDIRPEFAFIYISEGGKLRIGKMDVLMLEGDDYAVCMEHKTTSDRRIDNPDAAYWAKLHIDTQVCVYRDALKLMYPDRTPKVVYDVILKTAKKPLKGKATKKKDETVEQLAARREAGNESLVEYTDRLIANDYRSDGEAFVRKELPLLDRMQRGVSREIDFTIDMLSDNRFMNIRNPAGCTHFGSACDFLGVCTGSESLDFDEGLFSRKTSKHVEMEIL